MYPITHDLRLFEIYFIHTQLKTLNEVKWGKFGGLNGVKRGETGLNGVKWGETGLSGVKRA